MTDVLTQINMVSCTSSGVLSEHRAALGSGKFAVFSFAMGFPMQNPTSPVLRLSSSSSFYGGLYGGRVVAGGRETVLPSSGCNDQSPAAGSSKPLRSIGIGKRQRWWEKGLQPNMREIKDAQDLVDSLLKAGDTLVVVDFYSPGCGGCKALHPKICQLAEMNPEVQFLQVNYEEHKSMCYSLNVHVLPFFRFYRGAQGRLCSFSCTNATIKKFKDALAKHSPDRCSLGPVKGLEKKEMVALSANKDLAFIYTPKPERRDHVPSQQERLVEVVAVPTSHPHLVFPLPSTSLNTSDNTKGKTLLSSWR